MSDTKTHPRKSQLRLRGETRCVRFGWGQVICVHTVGEYDIIEYIPNQSSNVADEDYDSSPCFHPYVDGCDISQSFHSLDQALVGAIAYKAEGPNGRAATYFFKMIEVS